MASQRSAPEAVRWARPAREERAGGATSGGADQAAQRAAAFTRLYREHVEIIYRYHLARTGNVQDAQDLTAETFRAALEAFSRFQPERGSPLAWLIGIAYHKLVDFFRKERDHTPLDEALPAGGPAVEEAAEHGLRRDQLAQALRSLPGDRAEALTLHFMVGLSIAETGQVMGRSQAAIKKLVQRGLRDLRRRLAEQEGE